MAADARIEFGDFQTPAYLAQQACRVLRARGIRPDLIVEPTCGFGNFLVAAVEEFAECRRAIGLEINPDHHRRAAERVAESAAAGRIDLILADFFDFDWSAARNVHPGRALVVGNPPWVTVAGLSAINGSNAPRRENFQRLAGLDAKTGKSNFDIAEWIVLKLVREFARTDATIALLVKTSVARRVLAHAWKVAAPIGGPTLYRIDAKRAFNVSADACLFVIELPRDGIAERTCRVTSLDDPAMTLGTVGWRDDTLVADPVLCDQTESFVRRNAPPAALRWRSGVKHDCGAVLELTRVGTRFVNGLGETVDVEPNVLFPMLKGADVAGGHTARRDRWMLVPQTRTGEDTRGLADHAPRAWKYLDRHRAGLNARKSSIYRGRHPFSIFGVGPYTFQPWKVAVCGLYKQMRFTLVPPREGKPVVFDDTVYHLSFDGADQAAAAHACLASDMAGLFFGARMFTDSKRPITATLLQQLDLTRLAEALRVRLDVPPESRRPTANEWQDDALPSLFPK